MSDRRARSSSTRPRARRRTLSVIRRRTVSPEERGLRSRATSFQLPHAERRYPRPMDLGIAGKVAMVAASSQGIGLATAKLLAAEGAQVSICARREDVLEAAAAEIGGDTRSYVVDRASSSRTPAGLRQETGPR
ncbi:SDR family NAD(P)-dependent oxidoreductase [bacterium]|nr:MAG: SDR family NAD(P)-dependent oxidoreductase [bacterium]